MTSSTQRLLSLAIDYTQEPKKAILEELKGRLSACELCNDKVTAAAFGYLLAQEEQEHEDSVANAYDQVCEMIEGYDSDTMDSTQVADKVFTAIYTWLSKQPELSPDTLATLFAECMPPL
jgi:hypothetical protein